MNHNLTFYVRKVSLLIGMGVLLLASACSDDDPPLPDNVVTFQAASSGIANGDAETTITISLTRPVSTTVPLVLDVTTSGVTYGVEFTTEPAAVENGKRINLTLQPGDAAISFKVVKTAGIFLQGTESVSFSLTDAGELVISPESGKTELKFSAIVSDGGTLTLNGLIGAEAGSSAGNSVFVDLSNNEQTPVARRAWDLGFYNGDAFRVIINNTSGASVIALDKTDLAAVTLADVDLDAFAVGSAQGTFDLYDDVNGDLNHTAIPAIEAAAGKVYVINLVGGSGLPATAANLVKVRFAQKGTGYNVQYAAIEETTIKSADITKDAAYNFNYFSIANGAVSVEPARAKWDFVWTWSIYHTLYQGVDVPYGFSDLVFINHLSGTQSAEVLITEKITYDGFNENDLSSITFSSDRNTIGSNWRFTVAPDPVGVKKDRFYLIKDSSGNIYKLSFISFHPTEGGVRGKPQFKYALVKKAS
jgi:hypothetical protein